jgi:hypothetical protein
MIENIFFHQMAVSLSMDYFFNLKETIQLFKEENPKVFFAIVKPFLDF